MSDDTVRRPFPLPAPFHCWWWCPADSLNFMSFWLIILLRLANLFFINQALASSSETSMDYSFFFLSWPQGMWIPDQGSNPCPLQWKHRVFSPELPGSPIWTIVFNQTLLVCITILILYYSLGHFLFWYNFQLREKLQKQCKELLSTYDPVSCTGCILHPWLCHFFFFPSGYCFGILETSFPVTPKSLSVCFLRARTLSSMDTTQLSQAGGVPPKHCYCGPCSSPVTSAAVPGASLYGSCAATQCTVQYGVTHQP